MFDIYVLRVYEISYKAYVSFVFAKADVLLTKVWIGGFAF